MKERPIDALTVGDLEEMITKIVRKVVREEVSRDYYVNEEGVKVLYGEEDIDSEYLAELDRHYEEIESGKAPLTEGETVVGELRDLGLDL